MSRSSTHPPIASPTPEPVKVTPAAPTVSSQPKPLPPRAPIAKAGAPKPPARPVRTPPPRASTAAQKPAPPAAKSEPAVPPITPLPVPVDPSHAAEPTPTPTPPPVATEPAPMPRRPRVIAMINQKGGVGKTTTSVNLGAALAQLGNRVLFIDLDPQAHLSLHLGIDPMSHKQSVYDLLTDDDLSASDVAIKVRDNITVIPSETNLAGAETELVSKMMTGTAQRILRNKVEAMLAGQEPGKKTNGRRKQPGFDFVLIDCPPSLGLLTINALTLAREVIVPMQAHFLALQGLSKLLETVQLVRQGFNSELAVTGIVLCMHEGQTILATEVVADLKAFLDAARPLNVPWNRAVVFEPAIRRNIKLAECPSHGKTIFDYAGDSHGADDHLKLAQAVVAVRV